jgi:hypothetical protein
MADKKITELDAVTTLATTDILPAVVDPGTTPVTKKITVGDLQDLFSTYVPRSTTPLTSTDFTGDLFSTTAKTLIDLSTVFGTPANIKAIDVRVTVRDSASSGATDCWVILSPNNTSSSGKVFSCFPVNDRYNRLGGMVNCNSDGDIYYQVSASGASTLTLTIEIWGYWL